MNLEVTEQWGFHIGDRVIFVDEEDPDEGVTKGQRGEVRGFDDSYRDGYVGVRWDEENRKYHDLGRRCDNRHGWWVPYYQIELESSNELTIDDSDINSLLEDLV